MSSRRSVFFHPSSHPTAKKYKALSLSFVVANTTVTLDEHFVPVFSQGYY